MLLILTDIGTDDSDGSLHKWKNNERISISFVRLKNRCTWVTSFLYQRYTVEFEWIDQSQENRVK